MSEEECYYDILGVSKDASDGEIRSAWRKKAAKYHPDRAGPEGKPMFEKIQEAYEVLSDKEKREIYDKYGKKGLKEGVGMDEGFGDIFSAFFGGGFGGRKRRTGPRKTESVKHPLPVSLEELYLGTTRKIRVTRTRICGGCQGTGSSKPNAAKTCYNCDGSGYEVHVHRMGPFVQQISTTCERCGGTGKYIDPKFICKRCKGKKVVSEKKTLEVYISKGMRHGQRIVFDGEADERPGEQPGDIIFVIQEKRHPHFERDGRNLIYRKKINLSEALTGVEFKLVHLDKRILIIKSKEGEVIRPGTIKQVTGEGMPTYRDTFNKGDLIIHFDVEFPKKLPRTIREQLIKILPPKPNIRENLGKDFEEHELSDLKTSDDNDHYRGEAYHEDDEMDYEMDGGETVQ